MFNQHEKLEQTLPSLYGLDARQQVEVIQDHFLDVRTCARIRQSMSAGVQKRQRDAMAAQAWGHFGRAGPHVSVGSDWAFVFDRYSQISKISSIYLSNRSVERAREHVEPSLMAMMEKRLAPAHALYVRYEGAKVWNLVAAGTVDRYAAETPNIPATIQRVSNAIEATDVAQHEWISGYTWDHYQGGEVATILACEGKLLEDAEVDKLIAAKVMEAYPAQRASYIAILQMFNARPTLGEADLPPSATQSLIERLL